MEKIRKTAESPTGILASEKPETTAPLAQPQPAEPTKECRIFQIMYLGSEGPKTIYSTTLQVQTTNATI